MWLKVFGKFFKFYKRSVGWYIGLIVFVLFWLYIILGMFCRGEWICLRNVFVLLRIVRFLVLFF